MDNQVLHQQADYSVDDLDCPICGNNAVTRFYYETAEEQIDCYNCGYARKFYISNLDEKQNTNDEFDWIPQYVIEEKTGYGAYSIRMLNNPNTEVGSFAEPLSEQYFIDLVEQQKNQIAYAAYTKLVDNKIEQVILINSVE